MQNPQCHLDLKYSEYSSWHGIAFPALSARIGLATPPTSNGYRFSSVFPLFLHATPQSWHTREHGTPSWITISCWLGVTWSEMRLRTNMEEQIPWFSNTGNMSNVLCSDHTSSHGHCLVSKGGCAELDRGASAMDFKASWPFCKAKRILRAVRKSEPQLPNEFKPLVHFLEDIQENEAPGISRIFNDRFVFEKYHQYAQEKCLPVTKVFCFTMLKFSILLIRIIVFRAQHSLRPNWSGKLPYIINLGLCALRALATKHLLYLQLSRWVYLTSNLFNSLFVCTNIDIFSPENLSTMILPTLILTSDAKIQYWCRVQQSCCGLWCLHLLINVCWLYVSIPVSKTGKPSLKEMVPAHQRSHAPGFPTRRALIQNTFGEVTKDLPKELLRQEEPSTHLTDRKLECTICLDEAGQLFETRLQQLILLVLVPWGEPSGTEPRRRTRRPKSCSTSAWWPTQLHVSPIFHRRRRLQYILNKNRMDCQFKSRRNCLRGDKYWCHHISTAGKSWYGSAW